MTVKMAQAALDVILGFAVEIHEDGMTPWRVTEPGITP